MATKKQKKAKEQKEIKKAYEKSKVKRLLPQSLLSVRMKELVEKNRTEFAPNGYESFLCIEDDDPHSFVSKILGSNFESVNGLKSSHFSSLVPMIRFFKVLYNVNGKSKKDRTIKERREITFPTSMSGDLEKRYRNRISFDTNSDNPNIGIRSVDWRFLGGNAYREKNILEVNMQLYAERMADFFAKVPSQSDSDLKYSDLFNHSQIEYASAETDSDEKILNEDFYTIEMEVGWSVPSKTFEDTANTKTKGIKRALEKLKQQKTTIHLNVKKMDFDINQDGSVSMNVVYTGHMQSLLNHPATNSVFEPEEATRIKESIKILKDTIKDLKRDLSSTTGAFREENEIGARSSLSPAQQSELDKITETQKSELRGLNIALKAIKTSSDQHLSSIIRNLLGDRRIRVYSFEEEGLKYQIDATTIQTISELGDEVCKQLKGVAENHEQVGFLKVPLGTSLTATGNKTGQEGYLKIMKHLQTGENSYYWYEKGSNKPATLDNGRSLISHDELGPLLDPFSKGSPLRDMQLESLKDGEKGCHVSSLEDSISEEKFKQINDYLEGAYSTIDWETESLKEYYEQFSKPTYYESGTKSRNGVYSIKYFYYGDLLDTIFQLYFRKYEKNGGANLRPVVGPILLANYSLPKEIGGKEIDPKTLVISTDNKDEVMKAITKVEYTANMADIPIALDSFVTWFYEKYSKKGALNFSFGEFLQSTLSLVNKVTTARDKKEVSIVPVNKLNPFFQFATVKMRNEDYSDPEREDYFGFTNKRLPIFNAPFVHSGLIGRKKLSDIRRKNSNNESPSPSLRDSGLMVHHESQLMSGQERLKTINYFIIGSQGMHTIDRKPEYQKDCRDGIPHLFVGADSGMVKNINFSLQENRALLADAYINNAPDSGPRLPIRGTFQAQITMYGNVFMTPHSYIYINPISLGLSNAPTTGGKSIDEMLGLSGYYAVTKIENYIQAGTYETKITTRYIGSGKTTDNPEEVDIMGRRVNKKVIHLPFGVS